MKNIKDAHTLMFKFPMKMFSHWSVLNLFRIVILDFSIARTYSRIVFFLAVNNRRENVQTFAFRFELRC